MESVRWNQHSAHLTHSVSELYKNFELTDCILDVEGKSINVHKTILAACSPYFKNLLKNDPAIARISMKDVTHKVMKLILDFVYYGEADVYITDVYSLMKTAELLEMTSLKHIICHWFQIELPCKDTNVWSMEDKCSVSCAILTRHDAMDLLEEQVPLVPALLHTREARLSFYSQSSGVHAIGDSSAKHLNNFQGVSGKSNTDQSRSDTPITFDSFKKNANQNSENMSEELVPLAFVAVSEIKEPIEGHHDSVLEDPLGEYSGIVDDTEERSVKQEFTLQSEVQVKKEAKDDNDVPESMADDVLITDELSHSLSSTKCNLFESCDQESGMYMNPHVILSDRFGSESCTSEKSHDLEVKFESICEISGADVKENKMFRTVQYLTRNVDDNTRTALLKPESVWLNSVVQHFSSNNNQEEGNEEVCDSSTSKVITPFALEFGTKTPALYKSPAFSSVETIFGEVRRKLKKSMKESDSSSHNGEGVHSTEVIKFSCNICCKSFRNVCSHRSHMTTTQHTHKGDRPYECEVCKKTFSSKGTLNIHMNTHTGVRLFECEVCKKTFSQKSHLNRHMLIHSGDRPYECEVCKKTFSQKGDLNRHILIHTGDRPYECEVCKKTFSQKGYLNIHMRLHKGDRPFECELCKKTFSLKRYLNIHMLTHTGDRPYECEVCKNTFSQIGELNRHMHTHNGDRPYECEVCKKTFSRKGYLNTHMNTHTGVRPYECEVCKNTFSSKGNLNIHMNIHKGVRPYECEICKKTFSQKGHLNIHMITHSGVRPFECEVCKRKFSQKGSLNIHMHTHKYDRM